MLPRNDQDVERRLRVNILKGQHLIIFVENSALGLFGLDSAKGAILR